MYFILQACPLLSPFLLAVPPDPTYQQHYLEFAIDQEMVINSRVKAFPAPTFQWFINGNERIPTKKFWISTYENETAVSTLTFKPTLSDVNTNCTAFVLCQAINPYGKSKRYFDVYLTNRDGKNCFSPPIRNTTTTTESQPMSEPESDQEKLIIGTAIAGNVGMFVLFLVVILLSVMLFRIYKRR